MNHQGHRVISVEDVAGVEIKDFHTKLKMITESATDMTEQSIKFEEKLQRLENDKMRLSTSVQSHIDTIVGSVQERGRKLQSDLDIAFAKRTENLKTATSIF